MISLILGIFTFVELNCENLFDCQHDSLKQDTEWLADGIRHWNGPRMWKKLNNIGQEIISCGEDGKAFHVPDLVALCEVENDSVMEYLTHRSLLRNFRYEYIMTSSPDLRGIDVALLYQPESFLPLVTHPLRVEPVEGMRPTRDILYVSGLTLSDDTLHVYVVHTPSRFGGEKKTRPNRLAVMRRLHESIDSLRSISPNANIIVAGDFNDYADSPSPMYLCENCSLTNVTKGITGSHGAKGTYKYQGIWESIDHVFLSAPLLPHYIRSYINDAPFLLEDDKKYGGVKPLRTYNGRRYQKGFSDHLPLVVRLNL